MSIEVTPPTDGQVVIVLPYDEAEILARLVGLANSGNLSQHAPELNAVLSRLIEEFGRNFNAKGPDGARRYTAVIHNGQGYIEDVLNPPF